MHVSLSRTSAVALLFLVVGCKDKALEAECQRFPAFVSAATARAAAAVPMEQRQRQQTGADRAAWHRQLAAAFEQESKAPATFKTPKVQAYEAQVKQAYALSAAALRKTADGMEKADKALVEQGQVDDVKATGARDQVLKAVEQGCLP